MFVDSSSLLAPGELCRTKTHLRVGSNSSGCIKNCFTQKQLHTQQGAFLNYILKVGVFF